MSARKIESGSIQDGAATQLRLSLSLDSVRVRKSGIEFHTAKPIAVWTEMSVDLRYPDSRKMHCNGVVVACSGTPHSGYTISLLFTKLSRQSQVTLRALA
jgi:hypothetical protein